MVKSYIRGGSNVRRLLKASSFCILDWFSGHLLLAHALIFSVLIISFPWFVNNLISTSGHMIYLISI